MDVSALHEQNQAAWNEAANQYAREIESDVAFLRAGGKHFCPPEFEYLQNLDEWCNCAIHLQCAGGRDTLSLLNLGAKRVVGVDISPRMIEIARAKSAELAAPAQWYRSDVLETPHVLDGTADLVYTGRGAINWLMDLPAWARVVARLLKPGGKLYLFEGHPVQWVWDMSADDYRFDPDPRYNDYFSTHYNTDQGWATSYIAADTVPPTAEQAKKNERQWTVAAIVNAVIEAGLRIERIGEHPDAFWTQFPHMPDAVRRRLPNTFSLLATKGA